MSKSDSPEQIDQITDLLPLIDLEEIRTYELSASRCEDGAEESNKMDASILHNAENLGLRLKHTHVDSEAKISIDVVAIYRLEKPLEISAAVVQEFVEKIAFMTLVPYLREGVATMAAKLGVSVPLLKIVRQGQFTFPIADDPGVH